MDFAPYLVSQSVACSFSAGLLLAAVGCGDPKSGGPSGTGMSSTVMITAESGGMVTLEGTTLTVPGGAVPADTMITITSTTDSPPSMFRSWNSPVYKFGPDGLVFLAPVALTLTFTGAPSSPAVLWDSSTFGLENLGGTVAGTSITTSITHFSIGFVASAGFDAGTILVDAPRPDGRTPIDSGGSPMDSNNPPGDAPQPDGGVPPVDGSMSFDSGVPGDSGVPQGDGGVPPQDGGATGNDGGGFPIDAGTPDAGSPPDGGPPLVDAGVVAPDA